VGVNTGDVIIEPHDIFGDGVNIAARLESIAEPGGICISSSAYDYVRGKVGVEFVDLREQSLKNITLRIRAYAVVRDGSIAATQAERARLGPFSPPSSFHRCAAFRQPQRRSRARVLRGWGDRKPDH
jgi:hypothetical protein